MIIEPLDSELVKLLLEEPQKPVRQKIDLTCKQCSSKLDQNGYCTNGECEVDAPIPMFGCSVCGWCSTPERCVSSFICPRCDSSVGELCTDDRGGLTGYHKERWNRVHAARAA